MYSTLQRNLLSSKTFILFCQYSNNCVTIHLSKHWCQSDVYLQEIHMFLSLCGIEEMSKKYKGKKHKVLLGYKTGSLDAGQEEYKEKN